ncbi:chromosomal replication initiator protein DnaA [Sphingomonas sp. 2R-10]|uniref:chromosomal replication initiator protein DnaA n=1 Tax=Sphingomonas sp. 2R-10 TaxID=3045148 RepID=UPI000F76B897|nr:chromosomal replication initiator protein DnaA [Sphingomonas sp. 2R-10]MDJ0275621.1 chromosomal replication initiator protein DnaA [Sphingomonas sp. 2R-10]
MPVDHGQVEVAAAWARVRQNLRASAGQRLFDRWLKPMELVAPDGDGVVRLTLPSAFMTDWVRNHYAERLTHEFRAQLPQVRDVVVETATALQARIVPPAPMPEASAVPAPLTAAPAPAVPQRAPAERPTFDPRYRFDRFVVSASNRVAFNAAKAVAEPGVPRFSPLFLHSGTGLGKTHLMHAIGHAFLDADPAASAVYLPAERFMFEFVAAMRARDTHGFKAKLRGVDLLMIDDLQFVAGKDATQEECLHTINAFMDAGKRVVIACDRSPALLDGIDPRLLSRLGGGLVADIKTPETDLRHAILAAKLAEVPGIAVPGDVVDLLAGRIRGSVRELEGALNRLIAYASLTGDTIDMAFAHATLGEMLAGPARRVTIDDIQRAVSAHFEVKQLDLVSARRAQVIARPRQVAMYLAKRLTTRSLPEIGRKFGNRDHSTVIHAVRRIEELRGVDREIDTAVRTLLRSLEG